MTTLSLSPSAEQENARNVLGPDVRISGTLKFAEALMFDGQLDGEILSAGNLTVGRSAKIEGDVKTRTVVVHGTVEGNIEVTERCQLKADSSVTGDLKAARLLVEEGATFIGRSEVPAAASRPEPVKAGRNSQEPPARRT